MNWLKRIFGPSNSLILLYDHIAQENVDEMETQLKEVQTYYKFSKLSELANSQKRSRRMGLASVVFPHARRSVLMRAIPLLRELEIPATVFLTASCIGSNRLPLYDELEAYRSQHSDELSPAWVEETVKRAFDEGSIASDIVATVRGKYGPPPIDSMDPMLFFATWRQIVELPLADTELGFSLEENPRAGTHWKEALSYVRKQSRLSLPSAFSPFSLGKTVDSLRNEGVFSVVSRRSGVVERATSPWDLPHFLFEEADSG